MRAMKTCLMVAVFMLMGAAVNAEDKVFYITSLTSTTMPSIDMKDKPLEKALTELKTKVPDFNFVIHRGAGVAADYPVLPAMTLQNVSVDQFLTLIGDEYPNVHITRIPDYGDKFPPLIEVDIQPDAASQPVETQKPVIRLFALEELIDLRADPACNGADKKQISNDILSLIQTALQESYPQHMPELKVHEPTKTLIFKGTTEQAGIVAEALDLIRVSNPAVAYEAKIQHQRNTIIELQHEFQNLNRPTTQPQK